MNDYGKEYYDLLEKYGATVLQREELFEGYNCFCDAFPLDLINNAEKIAKEKAPHMNKKNQNGKERTIEQIEGNVFKGIVSEMIAQCYLKYICGLDDSMVRRYDLERPNFKYNHDKEYDLAVFDESGKFVFEIGVKSSKIKKDKFIEFCKEQHCIIGNYFYKGRSGDKKSAFYMGIVISYDVDNYRDEDIISLFKEKKAHVHLISGATIEEMEGEKRNSNIAMSQDNTTYDMGLRSVYAGDALDCAEKIRELINRWQCGIDAPRTDIYRYSRENRLRAYVVGFDKYGIYHTLRNCEKISTVSNDNIVEYADVREAVINGHRNWCKYCKQLKLSEELI